MLTQPTDILKQFGKNLRALRLEKGLTQEELAFQAGLHRTYVGAIERGERNVALKNIARLAHALDVDICQFFLGRDQNDVAR